VSAKPPLRKALGQHHLTRPELCAPLVEFLRPNRARVVEVGPGEGALTGELLNAGAAWILACEIDPAWAFHLAGRSADPRLHVMVADALDYPWRRLPAGSLVAGNLPYNVATPIIDRVLDAYPAVERAAFLVQLEVARRLVAEPGSPDYGGLSVLVRARADARILGRVRPGAFRPPPKVDSAFVGLRLRVPAACGDAMADLRAVVWAAFGLRRKTLRNALAASWGKTAAEAALGRLDWDLRVRAESRSLPDFLALSAVWNQLGRPGAFS
jgi:16S rRNA (adenine1518-N6/adenine1519-N6)-dimethyltransferase